ncbi:bacteriocin immunity protein [Companilactobacillus kimchiensis]|uniref:Bacteriocin immunity protein n=1 Tax=Companilactobacillus kimchiensis TaxID=993692 RepID=A0A0R2LKC8_9LACO|nr:bacteriocin immunity protein [Companilactobacillus kimchiensis]KRO00018.1 hypothetical protein IV57_GL002033 [Companilactobacillus kimchiensis]
MDIREDAKLHIHNLYNSLNQRQEKPSYLLNITDVLAQVYLKMDTAKNPEVWLNRLANYIYNEEFNRIHLTREEDKDLMALGNLSKSAGWNGMNRGNFNDKSQFYSIFERMPRR